MTSLNEFFDVINLNIFTLISLIFDLLCYVFIVFLRVLSDFNTIRTFVLEKFHAGMLSGNSELNLKFKKFPVPTGTGILLPFCVGPGLISGVPRL